MAPWWVRQYSQSRLDLTVDRRRARSVHPTSAVEQHHHPDHVRSPPRHGRRTLIGDAHRRRGRCANITDPGRRIHPRAADADRGGGLVVGSVDFLSVLRVRRVVCSRSRPSSRPSTCPAARSSIRRWPRRRMPTSLRLEGMAIGIGWIATRRSAWDPGSRAPLFTWRDVAFVCGRAAPRTSRPCGASWDDRPGSREALAALDAMDSRPTASCPSTRVGTSTGPAAVASSSSTIRSSDRGRRPWLRDPLARPGTTAIVVALAVARRSAAGPDRPGGVAPRPTRATARPDDSRSTRCARHHRRRRGGTVTRREAVCPPARGASWSPCVLSRPRSSSPSPRTRPTTSAWRGTWSRGGASYRTRCWSYQTEPLIFPKAAFEVWLPLPTWLIAGDPDGAPGRQLRRRPAADHPDRRGRAGPGLAAGRRCGAERDLPTGRARTLALGTGLTTAVYLPLLLHSALPDSTMPFAALALAACLLMTRLVRDPRGARLTDPASSASASCSG